MQYEPYVGCEEEQPLEFCPICGETITDAEHIDGETVCWCWDGHVTVEPKQKGASYVLQDRSH